MIAGDTRCTKQEQNDEAKGVLISEVTSGNEDGELSFDMSGVVSAPMAGQSEFRSITAE